MNITIHRDGLNYGPYSLEEAQKHLKEGSLLETDAAWHDGSTDWNPLGEILIKLNSAADSSKVPIHARADNPSTDSASDARFDVKTLDTGALSNTNPQIKLKTVFIALISFTVGVVSAATFFAVFSATVKPSDSTYSGPPDALIENFKKDQFSGGDLRIYSNVLVTKGAMFLSANNHGIIDGTPIYPVKISATWTYTPKDIQYQYDHDKVFKQKRVYNCYQDSFDEWKYSEDFLD